MKNIVLVLVVVCLASTFAVSQDRAQIYGGWQYTSIDASGISNGVVNREGFPKGWNADVSFKVFKHVSLVGDFSGAYKSKTVAFDGGTAKGKANVHTFMFGPRFSTTVGRLTPFGEALFGVAHSKASAEVIGANVDLGSDNSASFAFGGGLDLNVSKRFAVRLGKLDYVLVRNSGMNFNNFAYSAGVVFRF